MEQAKELSFVKKWWVSVRPFSLSASTMPVVFGTVLAAVYSGFEFKILHFILAFLGMVILHSGANILNDIFDYKKGLDKAPTPVSGGVVRGIISIKEAKTAVIIMMSVGFIIGLVLTYLSGIWLLAIGLLGLFVGIFYTNSNSFSLKYNGLGDLAVFLNFGILGSLGAWYVQTGNLSWLPAIWSIPMSTLVIAILHANNWRDIESDKNGKITTVASLFGDKGSLKYYGFLIYGPFLMIIALILVPYFLIPDMAAMPFTFLITLLALPITLNLWKKALNRKNPKKPIDFVALDGATAQLNLAFGLLCTIALFLNAAIEQFI